MTASRKPTIGVFDSGVGGLTVLHALLEHIPGADYLYFGDTARLPYGSKSAATVAHYATGATRFLQDQGADLLVIACNTATALALDEIKAASGVGVIGVIEPGAAAAAAATRKKSVVVIGTDATIGSHAYRTALESKGVAVREKGCPLFVPLVEEGWTEHPVTEQVAQIYLTEAFSGDSHDADVLVSGMHALSADQALAAAGRTGACDDRGLGRIHGSRGRAAAPGFAAPLTAGTRQESKIGTAIFCHRFRGKVSEDGVALSGTSGGGRVARGFEGVRNSCRREAAARD